MSIVHIVLFEYCFVHNEYTFHIVETVQGIEKLFDILNNGHKKKKFSFELEQCMVCNNCEFNIVFPKKRKSIRERNFLI